MTRPCRYKPLAAGCGQQFSETKATTMIPRLTPTFAKNKKRRKGMAILRMTISVALSVALFAVVLLSSRSGVAKADDTEAIRIRAKLNAIPATEKVSLTNDEWGKILPRGQFHVLPEAGTELPFLNEYANSHQKGIYVCAACGIELFSSETKFDSGTGWPSFYAPIESGKITAPTNNRAGIRCVASKL